jgi:NADH dehydrogenase (ubiquinone) 1 alpha subcomplex subunit 8
MDADSPKTSTLYALHKHIATTCKGQNKAFLACKEKDLDPSKCMSEGKAVITCVKDLCAL